jgi:hypothetical protein
VLLLLVTLLLGAACRRSAALLLLLLLVWRLLLLLLLGAWWGKHVGPRVVEAVHCCCQVGGHVGGLEQGPVVRGTPHACHCCRRGRSRCC